MKTATKADLVSTIYNRTGVQRCDCEVTLDMFLRVVKDKLIKGDSIFIRGFGTFSTKDRAARPARNPRKPEEIVMLPDRRVPYFKFSPYIKQRMNRKNESATSDPAAGSEPQW